MKNNAANLTIPAANLDPRNIDSLVIVEIGGGTMVGTLEAYSKLPDGKLVNLKLRGCEAVNIEAHRMIGLARSSDYNTRIARSLSMQETLTDVLTTLNKAVAIVSEISNATHDIADAVDVPDSPAELAAVTPLVMASA